MKRCKVCGKSDFVIYVDRCVSCCKWFADIKANLWKVSPMMWRKAKVRGLL